MLSGSMASGMKGTLDLLFRSTWRREGSLDKLLFHQEKAIQWEKLNEIAVGTAKDIAYLHEECQ